MKVAVEFEVSTSVGVPHAEVIQLIKENLPHGRFYAALCSAHMDIHYTKIEEVK